MQKPGPTAQEEVTFEIMSAESAKSSLVEIPMWESTFLCRAFSA